MDLYRLTVGLWARGILQEYYGVMPSQIHWFTSEPEGVGFQIPTDVRVTIANENVEAMLLRGDVDAVISPNVLKSFRAGDPRVRRLFQPCRPAVEQYFADTAIFPITHTVVVREALLEREPWIVDRLVDAFAAADAACRREYDYPKRLSFPTAALVLEGGRAALWQRIPWQHGLAPNAHTLEKFMQYAASQGYTPRAPEHRGSLLAGDQETPLASRFATHRALPPCSPSMLLLGGHS